MRQPGVGRVDGIDYLTDRSDLDLLRTSSAIRTSLNWPPTSLESRMPHRCDWMRIVRDDDAVNWREITPVPAILVKRTGSIAVLEASLFISGGPWS